MIKEFKSKEQLEKEAMKENYIEILKYGGYDYEEDKDKWDKIYECKERKDIPESDITFFTTKIIDIKLTLRFLFKEIDRLVKHKDNIIEYLNSDNECEEDLEKALDDVLQDIENKMNIVLAKGQLILLYIFPLTEKLLTVHEICQVLGSNLIESEDILKDDYSEDDEQGKMACLVYNLAEFIEARCLKNEVPYYYEAPFYYSVRFYLVDQLCNNPDLKELKDEYMADEEEDKNIIAISYDEDGNIISAEKVYQSMTLKDIIDNFEGDYINTLKKEKCIDLFKMINIKKIDEDSYAVLDDDGSMIGYIYKD